MSLKKNEELPVIVKWIEFMKWLFQITEKFPKRTRFTFANRIDNLALDTVEDLIDARYNRNRIEILKRVNLRLEKIRILLRISKETKILPYKSYESGVKSINDVGNMLGGWIKHEENISRR